MSKVTAGASRIVITGAGGRVGTLLAAEANRQGRRVLALRHHDLDITDPAAAQRHLQVGDVVINCAAQADVDAAEQDPAHAAAVNVDGPRCLAASCAQLGTHLIHLSTDYVFGAHPTPARAYEPSDPTAPLSVYGRSKLAGEQAVLAALPSAQVVRTAWLFTAADADFVATMRRLAATDEPVRVVADQVGSPTFVGDLVIALLTLADNPAAIPVVHVANAGQASRYEQAVAVFTELGADPDRVEPVTTAQMPRPAARPRYSALGQVESAAAGAPALQSWRAALADALRDSGDRGRL